jgi:hypothetical protein
MVAVTDRLAHLNNAWAKPRRRQEDSKEHMAMVHRVDLLCAATSPALAGPSLRLLPPLLPPLLLLILLLLVTLLLPLLHHEA